jgi:hypothetical protein
MFEFQIREPFRTATGELPFFGSWQGRSDWAVERDGDLREEIETSNLSGAWLLLFREIDQRPSRRFLSSTGTT